jgi:hypothetical protein
MRTSISGHNLQECIASLTFMQANVRTASMRETSYPSRESGSNYSALVSGILPGQDEGLTGNIWQAYDRHAVGPKRCSHWRIMLDKTGIVSYIQFIIY